MMIKRCLWVGLSVAMVGCASMTPDGEHTSPAPVMNEGGGNETVTQPAAGTSSAVFDPLGDPAQPLNSPDPLLKQRIFHFAFDDSSLRTEDFATLRAHARYLNTHPRQRVLIAGHADERGSREYNIALGERRAMAIRQFFEAEGVRPTQIDVVSYGEEVPLNRAQTEAAWAENRRAQLYYSQT
ncbi:MAG: peptidoglycan-associated lipoprotein Pal [Pseudomonadota bacterium]